MAEGTPNTLRGMNNHAAETRDPLLEGCVLLYKLQSLFHTLRSKYFAIERTHILDKVEEVRKELASCSCKGYSKGLGSRVVSEE